MDQNCTDFVGPPRGLAPSLREDPGSTPATAHNILFYTKKSGILALIQVVEF